MNLNNRGGMNRGKAFSDGRDNSYQEPTPQVMANVENPFSKYLLSQCLRAIKAIFLTSFIGFKYSTNHVTADDAFTDVQSFPNSGGFMPQINRTGTVTIE